MEQQNFFTAPQPMQPLAARLRPQSLEEFVGQRHLLAPGKVLWRLIEGDHISSMIFWGPPGVGKTTLARIIANRTKAKFIDFSAVTSGIKEIREVMQSADHNALYGEKTIVFVDEIHRFNKAQQDAFLPFVEKGSIVLIGATTENPSFEVNGALLSRCKVFVLHALTTDDLTGEGSPRFRRAEGGHGPGASAGRGGVCQRGRPFCPVHAGNGGAQRRSGRGHHHRDGRSAGTVYLQKIPFV